MTVSDENGTYCYIAIPPSAGAVNFTLRLQIELGEPATAYEPYNGQTYTIDLDGGTPDVTTLKGQNNIWSDVGDVEVEYRADTKLYIQKVLNA